VSPRKKLAPHQCCLGAHHFSEYTVDSLTAKVTVGVPVEASVQFGLSHALVSKGLENPPLMPLCPLVDGVEFISEGLSSICHDFGWGFDRQTLYNAHASTK
jgi:hypothetical protein